MANRCTMVDLNGVTFSIHELAKQMMDDGYTGEGMNFKIKAFNYILLAADDPNVESELPESGFRFWGAARFQYKLWKARQKYTML
jgi:hypothetical protein